LHSGVEPYGTGDAAVPGAIHRNVGTTKEVRNAGLRQGGRRDAGEGADLDDLVVEREGPRDSPQHRFGLFLRLAEPGGAELERDSEFIAAKTGDDGVGAELVVKRARDAPQQPVSGV